jgi:hypothetical protein
VKFEVNVAVNTQIQSSKMWSHVQGDCEINMQCVTFFVLPVISQWNSYEDEAPPHFAYPVQVWLDNHCFGWWTGH